MKLRLTNLRRITVVGPVARTQMRANAVDIYTTAAGLVVVVYDLYGATVGEGTLAPALDPIAVGHVLLTCNAEPVLEDFFAWAELRVADYRLDLEANPGDHVRIDHGFSAEATTDLGELHRFIRVNSALATNLERTIEEVGESDPEYLAALMHAHQVIRKQLSAYERQLHSRRTR